MLTEDKIKKIRKQLSGGEPEGEIKNALRVDGYSEQEINDLFLMLSTKKSKQQTVAGSKQKETKLFILIGVCFLIAGISMLIIDTWLKKFGIPLIVLGATSVGASYFVAKKNNKN